MRALLFWGAAAGLFALAVCHVSGRLPLRSPRSEGVPEAARAVQGLSLPGILPTAASGQKSPATTPLLSRSREEKSQELQLEIGRALVSIDDAQRDQAYTQLLPELMPIDPAAVKRLVESCPSGPIRDQLLRHTSRTWSSADQAGAIEWAMAMEDDGERVTAATEIVSQVRQADPARAIEVADLFGIGRDDGTVEHIVQLWATENLKAALHWAEAQPPGAQRDQLLARISTVQAQTATADAANTPIEPP